MFSIIRNQSRSVWEEGDSVILIENYPPYPIRAYKQLGINFELFKAYSNFCDSHL